MEYVMEWNLIYRDDSDMRDLIPDNHPIASSSVKADATGVNLFLEIEIGSR
jgi:extracellular factor (EF) 3-hydroxypalmitic acid methyl ester biosynthesis protein